MAVYIISPRKEESWVGINGNEGGIAETHGESMGKGDPRPAKYQRLSREIERLCMEIRMYRLPPEQPLIQGQDFRILHLNASSQEIGRKKRGAGFLIYSTRSIIFIDAIAQSRYHSISDKMFKHQIKIDSILSYLAKNF